VKADVKYENDSAMPIILPMVSRLAGYQLFRDAAPAGTGRPLQEFTSKSAAMFDALKLDPSQPDPLLFEIIQPGAAVFRIQKIDMVVRGPKVRPLPSGDYNLRARVDLWPADRRAGKALARSWEKRGKLWIDSVTLPSARIRIQELATPEPCRIRVD
jgi:hypothetical protein